MQTTDLCLPDRRERGEGIGKGGQLYGDEEKVYRPLVVSML